MTQTRSRARKAGCQGKEVAPIAQGAGRRGGKGKAGQVKPTESLTVEEEQEHVEGANSVPEQQQQPRTIDQGGRKVLGYRDDYEGPFILIVEPTDGEGGAQGERARVNPMKVGRALRTLLDGSTQLAIKATGRSKVRVTAENRETILKLFDSEAALSQRGLRISVPQYLLSTQLVIRGVPLEVTEEELKTEIGDQLKVLQLDRLNRRVKGVFTPSMTVRIKVQGASVPPAIRIFDTVCVPAFYVPQAKMCFKCFRFGHIRKQCRGKALCAVCGERSHAEPSHCKRSTSSPCCVNCKGEHTPLDKSCPEHAFQRKVRELAASRRVSQVEALKFLVREAPPSFPSRSGNRGRYSRVGSILNQPSGVLGSSSEDDLGNQSSSSSSGDSELSLPKGALSISSSPRRWETRGSTLLEPMVSQAKANAVRIVGEAPVEGAGEAVSGILEKLFRVIQGLIAEVTDREKESWVRSHLEEIRDMCTINGAQP